MIDHDSTWQHMTAHDSADSSDSSDSSDSLTAPDSRRTWSRYDSYDSLWQHYDSTDFDVIDATIHLTSSDGEVWNGRLTQAGGGGDDDYQFVGEGRSVNTYMHERIYPISLNPPFQ